MRAVPEAVATVQAAPLDPGAHLRLGDAYTRVDRPVAAAACWRTARTLAVSDSQQRREIDERLQGVDAAALLRSPELEDHNRRYRLRVLATTLAGIAGRDDFSVVDIGGGEGALSLLLPRADYLLVEPGTNGLSGLQLPFADAGADIVCACHVLEHIPATDREAFLDDLRRVSRGHVVLLGPFQVPGTMYRRRLGIVYATTGAPWAREHLECGLPELTEVERYAADRGHSCTSEPVGAMPTALLMTLVTHYAHLAGRANELSRLNAYLNDIAPERMTNPNLPGSFLVHIHH